MDTVFAMSNTMPYSTIAVQYYAISSYHTNCRSVHSKDKRTNINLKGSDNYTKAPCIAEKQWCTL